MLPRLDLAARLYERAAGGLQVHPHPHSHSTPSFDISVTNPPPEHCHQSHQPPSAATVVRDILNLNDKKCTEYAGGAGAEGHKESIAAGGGGSRLSQIRGASIVKGSRLCRMVGWGDGGWEGQRATGKTGGSLGSLCLGLDGGGGIISKFKLFMRALMPSEA
jgi:hypothetical protein